jgi:Flp pilus assembly protein TadD
VAVAVAVAVSRPTDPEYAAALDAIDAEQYAKAVPLLESYVSRAPDDADAQNYLGFSYRKLGNVDAAFRHYDEALALNPKHRGAHEYLGEAYLMTGNLGKAEEHLQVLDSLCFFPCNEYTMLKRAVGDYKAAHPVAIAAPTK